MNASTWFAAGHVAIVTGGSRGLGKALARELVVRGVHTVIDARDPIALEETHRDLATLGSLTAIPGDVTDKEHVHALIAAAQRFGRLDLLVNNASTLGAIPLPRIDEAAQEAFEDAFRVNVCAPIHLMQHALRLMGTNPEIATIVNITSDAAVEAYPTWGPYGASKAALEHVSRVLAAELDNPRIRVLLADPGDMNTQMHRDAIPDADPATLIDPAVSARALLRAISEMQHTFERIRVAEVVTA